jgi:hypothetical protein
MEDIEKQIVDVAYVLKNRSMHNYTQPKPEIIVALDAVGLEYYRKSVEEEFATKELSLETKEQADEFIANKKLAELHFNARYSQIFNYAMDNIISPKLNTIDFNKLLNGFTEWRKAWENYFDDLRKTSPDNWETLNNLSDNYNEQGSREALNLMYLPEKYDWVNNVKAKEELEK